MCAALTSNSHEVSILSSHHFLLILIFGTLFVFHQLVKKYFCEEIFAHLNIPSSPFPQPVSFHPVLGSLIRKISKTWDIHRVDYMSVSSQTFCHFYPLRNEFPSLFIHSSYSEKMKKNFCTFLLSHVDSIKLIKVLCLKLKLFFIP